MPHNKQLGEGYLTNQKLIELLQKGPKDAYVVIDGSLVIGIQFIKGSLAKEYSGPIFIRTNQGTKKINGVAFTHQRELSNGDMMEDII